MANRASRRAVAALAVAALAALLLVPAASAHESIVSTQPSGQAKIGLGSVSVTFSGPIRSATLKVFDAAGDKASKGSGARDLEQDGADQVQPAHRASTGSASAAAWPAACEPSSTTSTPAMTRTTG